MRIRTRRGGGRGDGVGGFRRSHADATAAQRMVSRLESPQRLLFFDEVQLVALMTSNAEGAERFVRQILGDLADAPRDVRETVLVYVEEWQCKSVGCKAMRMHRQEA